MDDLKSSAKRVLAFWVTMILVIVIGILLCVLLSAVLGMGTPLRPVIGQGHSYHGGFHDHRL